MGRVASRPHAVRRDGSRQPLSGPRIAGYAMHVAFSRTNHRPWPLPRGRWTWRQSWKDLLFAHWPVPAELLRPLVPEGLAVQEFGGTSWVGVVPFRMAGVMRRPLPDIPWVSAFPELNLRLYVEHDDKPGVWFLSLDASNPLAVWAARRFFHLPYHHASIRMEQGEETLDFSAQRVEGSRSVFFRARFRPTSAVFEAEPGSLESFLTERYCLYARSPEGALYRADVHHLPWPLQKAEGEVEASELVGAHRLHLDGKPLLHFSTGVDVVVWPMESLGGGGRATGATGRQAAGMPPTAPRG